MFSHVNKMQTLEHHRAKTLYVIFSLVDKPEIYVGRINISSPYVSSMDKRWTYDGGNGYILILKYESFDIVSRYDFVTVSAWHYFYH